MSFTSIQPPLTTAEAAIAERLRTHVKVLAGVIGPRHMGLRGTMKDTVDYITHVLTEMGESVAREAYDVDGDQAVNLIVERQGTKHADEIIILGAHYDTDPGGTPGADDNASAVAVMLEAARLTRGRAAARTIRFVAFANEESPYFHTGLMGSQVHARACRARNEKVLGMLCLEMVGYYTTANGSQNLPSAIPRLLRWAFPNRGDFLGAVGNMHSIKLGWAFRRGFKKAANFPLFSISLPEAIREIRLSDNSSFWDMNYPALMLTDTSYLRNPHYHLLTDVPETLDYERMARVTVGVAGGVLRCAKGNAL